MQPKQWFNYFFLETAVSEVKMNQVTLCTAGSSAESLSTLFLFHTNIMLTGSLCRSVCLLPCVCVGPQGCGGNSSTNQADECVLPLCPWAVGGQVHACGVLEQPEQNPARDPGQLQRGQRHPKFGAV